MIERDLFRPDGTVRGLLCTYPGGKKSLAIRISRKKEDGKAIETMISLVDSDFFEAYERACDILLDFYGIVAPAERRPIRNAMIATGPLFLAKSGLHIKPVTYLKAYMLPNEVDAATASEEAAED